jgi:basic membrane protein A
MKTISRRAILGVPAAVAVWQWQLTSSGASHAGNPVLVRMVTHLNGLGDHGYNDLANAGGLRAGDEFGVIFEVIESAMPQDYVPSLQESAIVASLTVGIGDLLHDPVDQVAGEFTGRRFAIIDSVVDRPNVVSYTFREQEASFLGGALAGLTTASGVVGVIGGIRVPPIMRSEVGFVAGVRTVAPDVEILIGYVDSFEDPTLGQEVALAQIDRGADILFPIAGRSSDGAYTAAADNDAWILAADAGKTGLGVKRQLAVVRKAMDDAMFDAINQVVEDVFSAGHRNWGVIDDGVDLTQIDAGVPAATIETIDRLRAMVVAQDITVPTNDEELALFQPPAWDGTMVDPGTPAG